MHFNIGNAKENPVFFYTICIHVFFNCFAFALRYVSKLSNQLLFNVRVKSSKNYFKQNLQNSSRSYNFMPVVCNNL
jgi:hypothetical protein